MAVLRINGRVYKSIEPLFKANHEGDMIYEYNDALKLKAISKAKGLLCQIKKYGARGDPFWVVYVASKQKPR
jgi:hypothetical protein